MSSPTTTRVSPRWRRRRSGSSQRNQQLSRRSCGDHVLAGMDHHDTDGSSARADLRVWDGGFVRSAIELDAEESKPLAHVAPNSRGAFADSGGEDERVE